jgi:Lrp/AsnC family transcriptional regulator
MEYYSMYDTDTALIWKKILDMSDSVVPLPEPRIQRLEGEGIITGKVALVDQNKIGLGLSVFVSVESYDHSDAWLKKFADAVSQMPEVTEFYRMAGDVDYMLRVVVADMQSYDIFYKKLIGAIALKNVTSRFAMEQIKSVTALPVPAFEAA